MGMKQKMKTSLNNPAIFSLVLILSVFQMMTVTWGFFVHGTNGFSLNSSLVFSIATWIAYSFIYVALVLLPAYLAAKFFNISVKSIAFITIALTSLVMLFLVTDLMIYDLYNFHFNGFVWNLITTKGGTSSLGSGNDAYFSAGLSFLFGLLVNALIWMLSVYCVNKQYWHYSVRRIASFFMVVVISQMLMYGVADIYNVGEVLSTAKSYPFHRNVTFRGAAEKYFGIQSVRTAGTKLSIGTSSIKYPLAPIQFEPVDQPMNIVVLVAESLRWDRLDPAYMPNTWRFAQKGLFFKNHYSSGNGTREGLFGMFYGLYGSYWNSFLYNNKSPLLIDRLIDLNYEFDIRTSAKFSYPEFNKTLFSRIPLSQLYEADDAKKPFQRDEQNATDFIRFIKSRDKNKPFMSFFFFESTHARYDFPDERVIAEPYLKDFNYWGVSRKSLLPKIGELKNRYTNSAHWVDVQLGRIYDQIEKEGLLDNTIIVVTGDHGEEFMEKGFWGHNSSFVEEQVHVPLVMWVPGQSHTEYTKTTSHMDISTTLLQKLGASADSSHYSLGENILNESSRKYIVTSDWHSIGLITDSMKYRISYSNNAFGNWSPTNKMDLPLDESAANEVMVEYQPEIIDAIKNTTKFLVKK